MVATQVVESSADERAEEERGRRVAKLQEASVMQSATARECNVCFSLVRDEALDYLPL
jgi:hypothetical protein